MQIEQDSQAILACPTQSPDKVLPSDAFQEGLRVERFDGPKAEWDADVVATDGRLV